MKQLTSPRTGKMQEIVQGAGNGELEIPDFSFGFMQNDHARIAADVGIQGSKGKEIRLPLFSEFGQQRQIQPPVSDLHTHRQERALENAPRRRTAS